MTFSKFGMTAAFCLSLFLGGCGGGGGGTAPSSQTDSTIPTTPTGLSAQVISSTEIDLTWNASTDNSAVSGYYVYRGGDVAFDYSTSYSSTGLSPSTQYCFSVAAIDDEGNMSPQSASVCATTQATAPSPWITVSAGTANDLSNVEWTGSKLLAVEEHFGAPTAVQMSTDGLTWSRTPTTGFSFDGADDMIYGNNQFLAVQNDWFYVSSDGISWGFVYAETNSSVDINALAWSPTLGLYIAVGNPGYIATSTDGINWTAVPSVPTTETLDGAAWLDGRFYAVGGHGTVLTSANGLDWTKATSPSISWTLSDVAWNGQSGPGAVFVATGYFSALISNDGNTWTEVANPPAAYNDRVVWGGGSANVFVTVGTSNDIFTSPDGITWTQRFENQQTGIAQMAINDVAWTGTRFVAVGQKGSIFASDDGLVWSIVASGSDLTSLMYDGSHYIAAGHNGRMVVSTDATTWDYHYMGDDTYYIYGMAYNGSRYVAVGQQYGLYSNDGLSWDAYWTGGTSVDTAVIWDGAKFIRTGDGVMTWDGVTTFDGLPDPKWEWSSFGSGYFNDLYWDGTTYVAVGNSGAVITSPDASYDSWTARDSNTTATLKAVTKGNGRLVAVGSGSIITTSDDNGSTWTAQPPVDSHGYSLYGVTWTGSQFIAVGQYGMILTSSNGINWTETFHESYKSFYAVLSHGSDIVIAGASGTIIRNNP